MDDRHLEVVHSEQAIVGSNQGRTIRLQVVETSLSPLTRPLANLHVSMLLCARTCRRLQIPAAHDGAADIG